MQMWWKSAKRFMRYRADKHLWLKFGRLRPAVALKIRSRSQSLISYSSCPTIIAMPIWLQSAISCTQETVTLTILNINALHQKQYEPRHDKINKMIVRPAKTRISLGIHTVWSESSLSAWRIRGPLTIHWAHSADTDQIARMPAHTHFVGFVISWLIFSLSLRCET